MNITDLPHYQIKPRQPRQYEIPKQEPRLPGQPEIITGTIRELRGQMFRCWDDPQDRYFRATDAQVVLLQAAIDKNYKVEVVIENDKIVKGIKVL